MITVSLTTYNTHKWAYYINTHACKHAKQSTSALAGSGCIIVTIPRQSNMSLKGECCSVCSVWKGKLPLATLPHSLSPLPIPLCAILVQRFGCQATNCSIVQWHKLLPMHSPSLAAEYWNFPGLYQETKL